MVQAKASGSEENPVLLSGAQLSIGYGPSVELETFSGTLLHFYPIL